VSDRSSTPQFKKYCLFKHLQCAQPELDNRLDAVWNILTAADSLGKLRAFRSIPDVARALDGLTDEEALELIERRR